MARTAFLLAHLANIPERENSTALGLQCLVRLFPHTWLSRYSIVENVLVYNVEMTDCLTGARVKV